MSEHLLALKELDLVKVRPDGNYRIYSFNPAALIGMSKEIFSQEQLASLVDYVMDDSERKVMAAFFEGDQLVNFPSSQKRYMIILRWLASKFEEDVRHPEKQVNEILGCHNEDDATLRRDLVDFGFMAREKGIYWRLLARRRELALLRPSSSRLLWCCHINRWTLTLNNAQLT